jgi:dephospho-CoA kinase
VFAGKPIIAVAGGIGSGKTFIANLFGELGCLVLSADEQVRRIYIDPEVKATLRRWWGEKVFNTRGELDRRAVASIVFADPMEKQRLEGLVHPRVAAMRDAAMSDAANDAQVLAYVWDIPLLFEAGLHDRVDAVVFVEAPWEDRLARVGKTRGWDENELRRRENLQTALDNKRRMSNYILKNTADLGFARNQVREILSEILKKCAMGA